MDNFGKIKLKYVAYSYASAQKQSEVFECGKYEVYGASGLVGYLNTYGADTEYIGIVKDGAGVGRAQIYKPYTSMLGTMAYIVPIDAKATNINFLKYSIDALDLGNTAGDRATIPHIYFSKYGNEYIASYPIIQQEKIANYLDEKCGKIDELIANQEKQIEKLKEYKQSVITEAVTKGLDKAAPLKDSGIEWIGEINLEHSVWKLKYLLQSPMMYGANESGEMYSENSVRYIRITDITMDSQLKDTEENLYLSTEKAQPYLLKDEDVLFARSGGTVGKSFIYKSEYGLSAFAGYLIKAECDKEKLLPEYLFFYTQSSLYELWKNMIFIQATIQNIGANKYSNMEIIIPSIEGQHKILNYLKGKCGQIDSLIAIKQEKIEKLQEYKKSLIYEYVTGKKEVV